MLQAHAPASEILQSEVGMGKFWAFREKHLENNDKALRILAVSLTVMYAWILIWALIFKLCNNAELIQNYYNLRNMTALERIMWDIIPFNYRGEGEYKMMLVVGTVLNCLVFVPFGVTLNYVFKKRNILRDAGLCLGFSLLIESTQLLTPFANPATEDLITNLFGYFIGLGIYYLLFRRLKAKSNVIIAAVICIIFAVGVVYSIVTYVGSADLILKLLTRTY